MLQQSYGRTRVAAFALLLGVLECQGKRGDMKMKHCGLGTYRDPSSQKCKICPRGKFHDGTIFEGEESSSWLFGGSGESEKGELQEEVEECTPCADRPCPSARQLRVGCGHSTVGVCADLPEAAPVSSNDVNRNKFRGTCWFKTEAENYGFKDVVKAGCPPGFEEQTKGMLCCACGVGFSSRGREGKCKWDYETSSDIYELDEPPKADNDISALLVYHEAQLIKENVETVQGREEVADDGESGPRGLVSVMMITNNRPVQVNHALADLAAQTYKNYELVIVDTSTRSVRKSCGGCQAFLQALEDVGRLRYIHLPDSMTTLGHRRALALSLARGTVVSHWDDDDANLPGRLEALVRPILRNEADVTAFPFNYVYDARIDKLVCMTPEHERNWSPNFASLTYLRDLLDGITFPQYIEANEAEDLYFGANLVTVAGARLKMVTGPASDGDGVQMVYIRHKGNTWWWAPNQMHMSGYLDPVCEGQEKFKPHVHRLKHDMVAIRAQKGNKIKLNDGTQIVQKRTDRFLPKGPVTKRDLPCALFSKEARLLMKWPIPGRSDDERSKEYLKDTPYMGFSPGLGFCTCENQRSSRKHMLRCPCDSFDEFLSTLKEINDVIDKEEEHPQTALGAAIKKAFENLQGEW